MKEEVKDKKSRAKPSSIRSARKSTLKFQKRDKFTQRKNAYSLTKKTTSKKEKDDEDKYGVPKKPSKKNYFGF